jgi:autotransporter-associated beta strand protein
MSAVRNTKNQKLVRNLGLLASASIMSMMMAGEAQAACVVNPNQPLNNITTAGTTVQCTGANTGQTIVVNGDQVDVRVNNAGSTLDNSTVTMTGTNNSLIVNAGASAANLVLGTNGPSSNLQVYGAVTNLTANLAGEFSGILIDNGGTVTAGAGNINLSTASSENQIFILGNGSITGSTNIAGAYLITGGSGSQDITIGGTLNVQSSGLAISTGADNDFVTIGATANFAVSGGINPMIFDGGSGNDRITWEGGATPLTRAANVGGFETGRFTLGAGLLTMRGNASYSTVSISGAGGTVRFDTISALGNITANVAIGAGATAELNQTGSQTLAHNFFGSGTVRQIAGNYIYDGNSTGFTGTFELSGADAILDNANAVGTANIIVNSGSLTFGDFTLVNNISGAGFLAKSGPGIGSLTGNNSGFSGIIDIDGGTLLVSNVNALGTGQVQALISSGTLRLDLATDQTLVNDLDGALSLVKNGTGVLDIIGNSSYTGGTNINAGAIRVDDFARLGTGPIVADVGGSLILNYNGASTLLQTTPFMTGDGSFIKEGTGDVVMNQTSTYTGGTIIRAGRIGLNNGDALGTGDIQIDSGAELGVGGIILNNNLTGSGLVRKTASNLVELYGDNRGFTGTIQVEDGLLFANNGNALGSGILQIDSGKNVQLGAVNDSIVAADLAGSGSFEKLGGGLVTLTGDGSQFTGGIGISDGTLEIEGSPNIGNSSTVFIGSSGTLQLNTAGSTNLFNALSGGGNLVKTGTGTVFLAGNNTHTGGTDIQQGAIRVTDTSFLGSGFITVQAGAALDLSIAGQQTLNQAISGAGILRKSNTGDLTLLGNSLTGGVDIVGGRVIVSTAAALGSGPVTTAVDTQLVFDNSTTEVSNILISGAGALTKNGTGLLVMNNANSFTGGTIINAGRLGLNNGMGLGTGNVIVMQNAILGLGGVTFANNVSGSGQIVKTANNFAVMTGTNTHSGGTDIQQGGIVVNSPAALGTGVVSLSGAGTTLTVDYSGATNVALNNQITGVGSLIKDGSGTVVMNAGGNSYSGGTTINAGRLGLNFGDALGTGNVVIGSGASLALGDMTYANNTSGAGQIVKTSAGLTNLTGTNTHSGGIAIQGGTIAVSSNAALGTGAIAIGSGAALEYTNAAAATFSNGLSGAGSFNKLGLGQLSFANNFTIGSVNLNAGRTRINTIATSNVTVGANGTLDGTGRIIGNLTNNGIVAPGNSIGTMTVQGNYTHNANSVLEIEFDAAGNIDLLDVTGNATLNGGTLRFVSIGGAEGQGGTFLRTGGTLTGTFATVQTVGALLPLAVVYEPNRAFMAPSVLTARPSTFNAQSMAAADTALGFIDSIGVGDVRHGTGNRIWLSGFGAWGKRSASGTTLGYDHDTRGLSGGANFDVGSAVTLGAAIGWAKGDITLGANGGGGDQSSVLGSLTARYAGTGVTFGGGLLYGKVNQDTLRNVSFNGFSGSVDGATDSKIFGGFAELGLPLGSTGGWAFSANARGSYIQQKQDGYTESGTSPLRLTLGDLKTSTLEGQAKLTAKTSLWDRSNGGEESSEGLDLRVDLGGRYLGTLGDREIPVAFAVSGAGIVLQGDTRNTLQGLAGLSLDYTTRGGATLSFGYRGEIGKTDRHALQAGVSFAF